MGRALLLSSLLLLTTSVSEACELCDGPGSSFEALQEHVEKWPEVALAEPTGRTDEGRLAFRVTQVLKGESSVGDRITPRGALAALPGQLWMLLGPKGNPDGYTVLTLRPTAREFLLAVPDLPAKERPADRLRAFLPWLTHDDPMVSASARKAFADAPFSAVAAAAEGVSAADLVAVLADPRRSSNSRGAMFLMLGVAGSDRDRQGLARWLRDPGMQAAPGFDALIAAWLMQAGAEGLEPVHRLLEDPELEQSVVGTAFVRALGFHARNGAWLVRAEVVAALRRLLGLPTFIGATLDELAKLEAWSELPHVEAMYERHRASAPWVVGPVLRFLSAHPGEDAKRTRKKIETDLLED